TKARTEDPRYGDAWRRGEPQVEDREQVWPTYENSHAKRRHTTSGTAPALEQIAVPKTTG
ncbi:MAG TPA: hypothetical protein VIO16_04765, partial [Dehalococcoidia bacterium]